MNLVDELLKSDARKANEFRKGIFKSKRLATIIECDSDSVEIELREVNGRIVNDIVAYQYDSKGEFDFSKNYDAKLMMCVEGISSPNLKEKKLQEHFSCSNAKELAEKLFGSEITAISDEISALSGIGNDSKKEEEIKN